MSSKKHYIPKPKTTDGIIDEKMKVLTELCVADKKNYDEIRAELVIAVSHNHDRDIDVVLDRVAKKMIREKFDL